MLKLLRLRTRNATSPPPKKRLLTSAQHSFYEISQPALPFHFQERFCAKFALWNLSSQRMFFIFVSRHGRFHKWTYRFPAFVYGRRKIPATLERAFYVAEDSSKFKLIIGSFQLKQLLSRRKILNKGTRKSSSFARLVDSEIWMLLFPVHEWMPSVPVQFMVPGEIKHLIS